MAISQVGGTSGRTGAVSGSTTITYSATAGNAVVIYSGNGQGNWTCADNLGNSLTAGPSGNNGTAFNGGTAFLQSFYQFPVPSSVTSYTLSYTGVFANYPFTLEEYSGVAAINASLSGNSVTGAASPATITVTTEDANDWIVCGFAAVNTAAGTTITFTPTVGTQRQSNTSAGTNAGTPMTVGLSDNTVASPGSVTCTTNYNRTAVFVALAIELRTVAPAPGFNYPRVPVFFIGSKSG